MAVTLSTSDAALATRALQHLGSSYRIADLAASSSVEGEQARDNFWDVWEECLSYTDWSFARRRLGVAASDIVPDAGSQYAAYFPTPADCLVIRGFPALIGPVDWAIEIYVDPSTYAQTSMIAITASGPLLVEYTFRQHYPDRVSPLFRAAFTHALAARLASVMADHRGLLADQTALAWQALQRAAEADQQNGAQIERVPGHVITGRV